MGALVSAPLACLGSCLGSCAGSCALGACCKACSCKCMASPRLTQWLYVMLIVGGAILAMTLKLVGLTVSFGGSFGINGFTTCFNSTGDSCSTQDSQWGTQTFSYTLCGGTSCKGNWAVYQVSFTLMCFFSIMILLTGCKSQFSAYAHYGHWFVKFIAVLGILISTAFMPPDVFAYYSQIAKFIAPLFMLYQMVMYIDFGYRINTRLTDADDEQNSCGLCCNNEGNLCKKLIVAVSAIIYIAEITGIALMYHFWPMDCQFNAAAVTTTLLFSIFNTFFSLSKIAPHGALLTSALVTGYCTWLCFGALGSMPVEECNPYISEPNIGQGVVSILFAAFALLLVGLGAGARASAIPKKEGANDEVTVGVEDDDEIEPRSFLWYHSVMLACSIYMAMLLTNWGDSEDAPPGKRYNLGLASAWVQLAANWVCSLLYLWTLTIPKIAHHCCPDRDFGVEFDD